MGRRRAIWCLWLLAACCLYFFENNLGTRLVLFASVLIPLASLGCACLAVRTVQAVLRAPEQAKAGEMVPCACVVSGGIWLPGCSARCVLESRNRLTGETSVLRVPLNEGGTTGFELTSAYCGQVRLTLSRLETGDWFGLWRVSKTMNEGASVLIEPARYPAVPEMDEDSGEAGEALTDGPRRSDEPGGNEIRGYVPGDPIRQIHWKLSGKLDDLLVRESAEERRSGLLLLLETAGEDDSPEALDAAARGLLSASLALSGQGTSHCVGWYDGQNGELVWRDVGSEAEFELVQALLLSTVSREKAGSIADLFRSAYPQTRFQRVMLFTPHAGGELLPLTEQQPVTVVLTTFVP